MANKTKKVQFDSFTPAFLKVNEDGTYEESKYQLSSLFELITENHLSCTKKRILGDNHMFHICKKHSDKDIWELQILHLREQVLPGISDGEGAYKLISLGDHEYPAESTTILYDEKKCILYMQRNRYGTSPTVFAELLRLLSPSNYYVQLKPRYEKIQMTKVLGAKQYKNFTLSIDSSEVPLIKEAPGLKGILNTFSLYEGNVINISVGFGHKRGLCLNKIKTADLIKEAYGVSGINKLQIGIIDNEDTKIEKVDLLDDRIMFFVNVKYSRENPITHERLYKYCFEKIQA